MSNPDNWLIVLACAATANVIMAVQYTRALWSMQAQTAQILGVLRVWAETWGEPAETVKERLQKALHS